MCQMWIKESNVIIPRVFWDAINDYNQEGIGIYNIDKKEIIKSEDYDVGWNYINEHKKDRMIVHHRLATSGAKTCDQLHGWDLENGYVFFHNGVLKTYHGTATKSDTQQLVEEWTGAPVKALVRYLEAFEKTSRFVLVHKETGKIIKPKCATWNPVEIKELGGKTVEFSNDYAFRYSKLPPAYSRWDGYDSEWGSSSSKWSSNKTYKTRSGATSKKRAVSVLDKKFNMELMEGATADWVHNSKRNTYVNEKLGLECFARPDYNYTEKAIVMPDVLRTVSTDDYYVMIDAEKNSVHHMTNKICDDITMNLVLSCGSAEFVNALVRIARTSSINAGINTWRNADLLAYIRSYELRIGEREKVKFTLAEFLNVVMTFDIEDVKGLTAMDTAKHMMDVLADELTEDFTYFASFKKRVHQRTLKAIKEEQEWDRKKSVMNDLYSHRATYW